MATERREISGDAPRICWLWGLLLVAVLLLLGGARIWSAAVMGAGVLIAWTAFSAILRLGRRRAWWT